MAKYETKDDILRTGDIDPEFAEVRSRSMSAST